MTDPGEFAGLPTEIPALCQVGQGLLMHILWAEGYDGDARLRMPPGYASDPQRFDLRLA